MKKIVVVLRKGPFSTIRASEALRTTLGLTLNRNNQLTVLYLDRGAANLRALDPQLIRRPQIKESLDLFGPCGVKQAVDRDSLENWGPAQIHPGVKIIERETALTLMNTADVILPM